MNRITKAILLTSLGLLMLAPSVSYSKDSEVIQIRRTDSSVVGIDAETYKVVKTGNRTVIYPTHALMPTVRDWSKPLVVIDRSDSVFVKPFVDPWGSD